MGEDAPTGCTFDFEHFGKLHFWTLNIWKCWILDFWVSFWSRGSQDQKMPPKMTSQIRFSLNQEGFPALFPSSIYRLLGVRRWPATGVFNKKRKQLYTFFVVFSNGRCCIVWRAYEGLNLHSALKQEIESRAKVSIDSSSPSEIASECNFLRWW